MFLLTFVVFIIAILGVYTNVLAVEASRFYQGQSGIARAMLEWHEGAASLANVVKPASMVACRLTATAWAGAPPPCLVGSGVVTQPVGLTQVSVTGGTYQLGAVYPQIATGYNFGNYQWKSVAFRDATGYHVITYVDAAVVLSSLKGSLGITEAELAHQVTNLGLPLYSYGSVHAGRMVTAPVDGLENSYAVPAGMPDGAFGIISNVAPCSRC